MPGQFVVDGDCVYRVADDGERTMVVWPGDASATIQGDGTLDVVVDGVSWAAQDRVAPWSGVEAPSSWLEDPERAAANVQAKCVTPTITILAPP